MRNALFTLMKDDATLTSLGVEKVYQSNAVESPPEACFLVLRWEVRSRFLGDVGNTDITILANSRTPNYIKLDRILARVRELMLAINHRVVTDGVVTQASWQSDGPDGYDEGWRTHMKSSSFLVNGRTA
jgi:hypothetical protein